MLACRLEDLRDNGVGFALLCCALVPSPNLTGWQLEHLLRCNLQDAGYYIFNRRKKFLLPG